MRMLEELAANEDLKATQRLRALEELGRITGRRDGTTVAKPDAAAPDPMADLDELEERRKKRRRAVA